MPSITLPMHSCQVSRHLTPSCATLLWRFLHAALVFHTLLGSHQTWPFCETINDNFSFMSKETREAWQDLKSDKVVAGENLYCFLFVFAFSCSFCCRLFQEVLFDFLPYFKQQLTTSQPILDLDLKIEFDSAFNAWMSRVPTDSTDDPSRGEC